MKSTQFGIDNFLALNLHNSNSRLAIVCNQASQTAYGKNSKLALLEAGYNLVKIFSPEHGFDSQGADGAYMSHGLDLNTHLPIISLYGDQLAPSEEDLKDVDIVLIDLPDVGVRFYTYLWTMSYVLESCLRYQKKVIVLDRPNPMGQKLELAEGPILKESCQSFIGRFAIPITHQLTFAELALYFKANYYMDLDLEIVKMKNWNRDNVSGYKFTPTSPAIQKIETIYTYPGACLFEGLNIDEGRTTNDPFAQFGAPWIEAERLYDLVKGFEEADVEMVKYTPYSGIYTAQECYGLKVIPISRQEFQSVAYFIKLIKTIDELFPEMLKERNYLTNVNPSGVGHLDKLIGVPNSFELLKKGAIETKLKHEEWSNLVKPYLLYR